MAKFQYGVKPDIFEYAGGAHPQKMAETDFGHPYLTDFGQTDFGHF